MKRYPRLDVNQPEIVRALRSCGVSVTSLASIGSGCPDLLCGYKLRNFLLEIKSEDGKLTSDERQWHNHWNGAVFTVRTVDEALLICGVTAKRGPTWPMKKLDKKYGRVTK